MRRALVNLACATIPDIAVNFSRKKTLADHQAVRDEKKDQGTSIDPELTAVFRFF